ncbi:hypothetical protein BJX66DRAFT_317411 [Aspergillus keveii]|uniref:Uncharacterized protein n=1 Tax=Aspergillus keveii TaxID=714993 RepID=A0ABR4FLT7_9EURO
MPTPRLVCRSPESCIGVSASLAGCHCRLQKWEDDGFQTLDWSDEHGRAGFPSMRLRGLE